VREYLYRYNCHIGRISVDKEKRVTTIDLPTNDGKDIASIFLATPVMVVLFHPELSRSRSYEPLNFLLSYGATNPIPGLVQDLDNKLSDEGKVRFHEELSPLDYFFVFQKYVLSYKLSGKTLCFSEVVALERI